MDEAELLDTRSDQGPRQTPSAVNRASLPKVIDSSVQWLVIIHIVRFEDRVQLDLYHLSFSRSQHAKRRQSKTIHSVDYSNETIKQSAR